MKEKEDILTQKNKIQSKNTDFKNKIRELKEEIKNKNEEIDELNNKLDEDEKLLDQYEIDIKNEKEINKKLTNQIKELELEINENTEKNNESINSRYTKKIKRLNTKIEEYENKLNEAEEQLKNTNSELSKLKKKDLQNSNNSLNKNEEIELNPENYEMVKCVHYNKKLKWILFKLKIEDELNMNINNNNNNNLDYEDFIWKPLTTRREFEEFGAIPNCNSYELQKQIDNLQSCQTELIDKLSKKENDYNRLNLNFAKLFNRKKSGENNQDRLLETIDKLKKENKNLQTTVQNIKNSENNFMGLSFIEDDLNNSQFIDDYNFEEVLNNLDTASIFTYTGKNTGNKITPQLKSTIESLFAQIILTQNVKLTMASIFKQIGFTDEDIYQLIGKNRGVISIPCINNQI